MSKKKIKPVSDENSMRLAAAQFHLFQVIRDMKKLTDSLEGMTNAVCGKKPKRSRK